MSDVEKVARYLRELDEATPEEKAELTRRVRLARSKIRSQEAAAVVGARIRWLRLEMKMSPIELAEAIGTSRPSLHRLERGGHCPSLELLLRLSAVLDTTVSRLLTGLESELLRSREMRTTVQEMTMSEKVLP